MIIFVILTDTKSRISKPKLAPVSIYGKTKLTHFFLRLEAIVAKTMLWRIIIISVLRAEIEPFKKTRYIFFLLTRFILIPNIEKTLICRYRSGFSYLYSKEQLNKTNKYSYLNLFRNILFVIS